MFEAGNALGIQQRPIPNKKRTAPEARGCVSLLMAQDRPSVHTVLLENCHESRQKRPFCGQFA